MKTVKKELKERGGKKGEGNGRESERKKREIEE